MCLVVFQKIFRKIFFSVWKMLQGKRQNQKNKHSTQIDARVRLALMAFDGAKHRSRSARRRDHDRRRNRIARRSSPSSIAISPIDERRRSHRSSIVPLVDRRAHSSDDRTARRSMLSNLGSLFSLSLSPIWALSSLSLFFQK